jgi:chorismate mutase
MELTEQNHYMLSYEIKKYADDAKKEINNRLNKLWRPLDSGETANGLLAAIRETTQKREAWVSAKQAINNAKYRNNKQRVGKEYEESVLEKFRQKLGKLGKNYIPQYWLTFILFGGPSYDNCLPIFQLSNLKKLQEKIIEVDNKLVSRTNRKFLKSNQAINELKRLKCNSSPLSDNSSIYNEKPTYHRHIFSLDNDSFNKMPSQLPPRPTLLSENEEENDILQTIKIMREAGMNENGTFLFKEDIFELTRKVVALRRARGNY